MVISRHIAIHTGRIGRSGTRSMSSSVRLFDGVKKFVNPQEFIQMKQQERVEEGQFRANLLNKEFEYNPKYIGENQPNPVSNRPIPLNVELLKYKPINLPQTHGHEVATIKLRGYDQDNLIRAGEFALRSAYYLGIPTSKLITEKTEKRLYTVIKSPFAQAKSKENFHRTTFNKSIVAYDANPEIIDLWLSYINKYSIQGVEYKSTITTRESLDYSKQLDELTTQDLNFPSAYSDSSDPVAAKVQELLKSDTFKKLLDESK